MTKENSLFLVYPLKISSEKPSNIKAGKPLYFSRKETAERMIAEYREHYAFMYDESVQEEKIYCLILEEFELDSMYRYQLSTSVFSPDGELLSDCLIPDDGPFPGRPESKIKHRVGDLIETPCGDNLLFGIIVDQPACLCEGSRHYGLSASDDCYTIIQYPGLEINYAHSPMVFHPTRNIPEETRKVLEDALDRYKRDYSTS